MIPSMDFFRPPDPASAFFPTYYKPRVAVSIRAIFTHYCSLGCGEGLQIRAIICLTLIWRGSQLQCLTRVLPPIDSYQGKDQFRGRFGADDEYADQAAIFAHSSDKSFTNKLATQWLAGCLDAQRATSVFGHCVLQMASGLDRHQADYNIGFVWYAKQIISQTYRNHFISAYLC